MYQTISLLPDLDTDVRAKMSGDIPVIDFGWADATGSTRVHAPSGTREQQAEWLSALAAKIDALAETVRDLATQAVSA